MTGLLFTHSPGTGKIVGRKNGKVMVEEEVHTTGRPAALRLSVDRDTLHTGLGDISYVVIEVVDENGYRVPDADEPIRVFVGEMGKLIGLDNGNPSDYTSMKSEERKTFNGLALAVIQTGDQAGSILVRVNSPSLKEASVEIKTVETLPEFLPVEILNK
jgi:beta-galactosidase